jgi:hypothetical protein
MDQNEIKQPDSSGDEIKNLSSPDVSSDEPKNVEEIEDLSVVEKITGVFVSPVSTFQYLARRPDFWTAFIVLSLIGIALAMAITPKIIPLSLAQGIEAIQNNPKITSDQDRQTAINITSKITPIAIYVGSIIGTPLNLALGFILSSLTVFLIGLIMGLNADFKRLLGVLPWLWFIRIFSSIIQTIIIMKTDITTMDQFQDFRVIKPFSAISLVPQSVELSKPIAAILSTIDPFFIWATIVMVFALQYANKSTRSQAITTTAIYLVLYLAATALMMTVVSALPGGTH